jgi:predicted transcriptional regulator of viral defense system
MKETKEMKKIRGLTDLTLERKFEKIKTVADESGIVTTKDAAKACGYRSTTSFLTYVLRPLIDKGYLKKIGGGVYRIVEK